MTPNLHEERGREWTRVGVLAWGRAGSTLRGMLSQCGKCLIFFRELFTMLLPLITNCTIRARASPALRPNEKLLQRAANGDGAGNGNDNEDGKTQKVVIATSSQLRFNLHIWLYQRIFLSGQQIMIEFLPAPCCWMASFVWLAADCQPMEDMQSYGNRNAWSHNAHHY